MRLAPRRRLRQRLRSPQGEGELEAAGGVVESVAKALAEPAEPVADRLRVDVELCRDGGDLALMVEPGPQGLDQASPRGSRLVPERRQEPGLQVAQDRRLGVGDEEREVVVGTDEPARIQLAAADQLKHRPGALGALCGAAQGLLRSEHGGLAHRAPQVRLERGCPGIRDQGDPGVTLLLDHQSAAGKAGAKPRPPAGPRQRRDRRGEHPAGVGGGERDRVRILLGLEQEQREAPAKAVRLTCSGRLLLRVALGGERRDLVDVREDRLGEQCQRPAIDVRLDRKRRDPSPRHPGAELVGGEQRVERAPLAVLAAAEAAIDVARGRAVELWIRDQLDELSQRLLDPEPDPGAEAPGERSSVGGDAVADRSDDLVAERGQVRREP